LSKKFISDLFHQGAGQGSSFEVTWPVFSAGTDVFSFHPGMKGVETKLLKEARERIFLIEKEAYEKGFEQGEKDGWELGLKRLEMVIHQIGNVLGEMERQRKVLYENYEREMLQLVFGISKRILRHELHHCEDVILTVLREAFQYVTDREKVIVRLNPVDYQYLLGRQEKLPCSFDEKNGVRLIEDPSIDRGGCFLETSFGEVDATFESQFDEIVSLIWQKNQEAGSPSNR